jgi:uncharacterized protein
VAVSPEISVRDVRKSDFGAVLRLNEVFVHFLSPLDLAELKALAEEAAYFRVIEMDGAIVAFLIAFLPDASYDSVNYHWFDSRFDDFAYVDRIAVSATAQGRSVGRRLYDDFAAFAVGKGMKQLACEYYCAPMNEGSAKFHQRYGFTEIGQQVLASGKSVSLQMYQIGDQPVE